MEPLLVWGLILLGAALVILVIDLFIPSAGMLAILSVTIAGAGIVCLFRHDNLWGLVGLLFVVIGWPLALYMGFKIMPQTAIGKKLILGSNQDDEERPAEQASPLLQLIGSEGTVITDLRPIGVIRIGDKKFDALSESTLIRAGATVKVIGVVDGVNLKVRAV
jgi:membrane-bound ClpP family serine protease